MGRRVAAFRAVCLGPPPLLLLILLGEPCWAQPAPVPAPAPNVAVQNTPDTPQTDLGPQIDGHLQLGAGWDSNPMLQRHHTALRQTWHGEGQAELRINRRVHAALSGTYTGLGPSDAAWQGESRLFVGLLVWDGSHFKVRCGSLSELHREVAVLGEGGMLLGTPGASALAIRKGLAESVGLAASLSFGRLRLGATLSGRTKRVEDAEQYNMRAGVVRASLQWLASAFSVRTTYAYDVQSFLGLQARNPGGVPVSGSPFLTLGVHAASAELRGRVGHVVMYHLRYTAKLYRDNFLRHANGDGHTFTADMDLQPWSWLSLSFGGYAALRRFVDRDVNARNPESEALLNAHAVARWWWSRAFGLYAAYRMDHLAAAPVGLLFRRHTATAGLTARIEPD